MEERMFYKYNIRNKKNWDQTDHNGKPQELWQVILNNFDLWNEETWKMKINK